MSEKRCCDCGHFGLSKDPIFRVITGICGRCGKEVGYTDKCLFEEESFDKYLAERLNEKEEIIKEQQTTIQFLKEENDNCRNDYRELFSNYVALEKENKQLKQKLENLDLNEKNGSIKMIDGKVFIRM